MISLFVNKKNCEENRNLSRSLTVTPYFSCLLFASTERREGTLGTERDVFAVRANETRVVCSIWRTADGWMDVGWVGSSLLPDPATFLFSAILYLLSLARSNWNRSCCVVRLVTAKPR
jgi:hypothetical protein